MWVWLFMLLSIIVVRFLIPDALGEKKKNLIFLGISFAIIVFVVGSRSAFLTTSQDLYNYYRWYGKALNTPLDALIEQSAFESGYLVLNKILAWFVPWNYFIVYFEAAFTTAVFFWYIYRNCDSVFLGVIIYICAGPWQFFLTGFRQGIAICMCVIALELMKKKAFVTDVVALSIITLAATIHTTAWIFLFAFLLREIKLTKKIVVYAGIVTLVLMLFLDELVSYGNEVLQREYTTSFTGNVLGGIVPIMIYISAFVLWYLIWSWNSEFIREHEFELVMLALGLCIYSLRYSVTIMERISYYYTFVIVVVLSNGITRQKTKMVRNISMAVCIAVCFLLFFYRVNTQLGEYHFYWEYLERLGNL